MYKRNNKYQLFLPGLKEIHRLTSQGLTVLRIVLKFSSGNTEYNAQYSSFSVAGPETDYQLTIGGYSGNAGRGFDSLSLLFYLTPLYFFIRWCHPYIKVSTVV